MYSRRGFQKIKRNKVYWRFIIIANLALVFLLAFIILRSSPSPSKTEVVSHSMNKFKGKDSYSLDIKEEPYGLEFAGEVDQERLSGKLKEGENREIEIRQPNGTLQIRRVEEDKWEEASEEGLEQIKSFFMLPQDIFHRVKQTGASINHGPNHSLDDTLCKTFTWNVDDKTFHQSLFPGLELDKINESTVTVYLTQEDSKLVKLIISLSLEELAQEKSQIERTLTINK